MTQNDLLFPPSQSQTASTKQTLLLLLHQKHHPSQIITHWPGKPTSVSSSPSTRNKRKIQNVLWAPVRPQRQLRRPPYPIWRLVEGACVMTELDWGDGMACWITTPVSWLGIRVLPSWWAPGPAMAPPTALCIEILCPEKTEEKGQGKKIKVLSYTPALKGQNWESSHVN